MNRRNTITGDSACPECRKKGADSTGNHLIHFSDGNKYCNRCGYKEVLNTLDKVETMNKTWGLTVDIINKLPTLANSRRGTSKEDNNHFGIKHALSEEDGSTIKYTCYPYCDKSGNIVAYKIRDEENKDFRTVGYFKGVKLFGYHIKNDNKKMIITEGEEDTVAAYSMLKKKYPSMHLDFFSLQTGATIDKDGNGIIDRPVLDQEEFLNRYDEIVLCLDNDKAGEAVVPKYVDWLGSEKIRIVKLPMKDASDCLVNRVEQKFISAFFNAGQYRPKSLITVEDVFEDAIKMPEYGRPFPWPSLNKATYGRRDGEGYYFGAGVKIGKSECLNQLVAHIITNEPENPPLLIKGEEIPALTGKKVAGKIFNKNFHDPTGNFTEEELIQGIEYIKDKFYLYWNKKRGVTWDDVKLTIRSAVQAGTKDVFIDPITCFTDGMTASDTDTFLKGMIRELDDMSKDLLFTYYIFCHLNNPPSGAPHEEGGRVRSNQFTGSRVMMRACSYMIGLERNKQEDDEVLRNTTTFRVLEDRMFGNYAEFPVFYNRQDGSYLEPEDRGEF